MVFAVVRAGADAGSTGGTGAAVAALSGLAEEIIEQLLPNEALRAMKPRRDNLGSAGSPVLDDVSTWNPKVCRGFFMGAAGNEKFAEITGRLADVTPAFPTT